MLSDLSFGRRSMPSLGRGSCRGTLARPTKPALAYHLMGVFKNGRMFRLPQILRMRRHYILRKNRGLDLSLIYCRK